MCVLFVKCVYGADLKKQNKRRKKKKQKEEKKYEMWQHWSKPASTA